MHQSDDKKPISPHQLFQKLLAGNYKQLECVDEVAHLNQQKNILLSLINEYHIQIESRMDQLNKLERLIFLRNKLRIQLEGLRSQRFSIDRNTEFGVEKNRVCPDQVAEHTRIKLEFEEFRQKNIALEVRLQELREYCMKLERGNSHLEKQNILVEDYTLRVRSKSDIMVGGQYRGGGRCNFQSSWRQKIQARRMQQQKLNTNLRLKIQQKQQQNRMYIRMKEQQIAQGNRRRMASFHQKMRQQF